MTEYSLSNRTQLKSISSEWEFNDTKDSIELEKIMIKIMLDNQGIGLAANQIGISKKIFVMGAYEIKNFPIPFAIFNPTIVDTSDEVEYYNEGCLSFPGLFLKIKRPKEIKVEFQNSCGEKQSLFLEGLSSRCFQHEFDHLQGVCFVDKVSQLKLQYAYRKLRKHYDRT
jgi:peptide deformylase